MDGTSEQPLTASKVSNERDDDEKDNKTAEGSNKPPPLSDAVETTVGVAATLDTVSDGNETAPPLGAVMMSGSVPNSSSNDAVEQDDPINFGDLTSPKVAENDLLVETVKQMVATLKRTLKGKRVDDLLLDRPSTGGGGSTGDMKDSSWTALNFLIGIGLVQEQEPQTTDIGEEDVDKVVIWWEFAREGRKTPAVASIPAACETRLKRKMSQLVREETMLDIWLSRLRQMQRDQLTTPIAISQKTALSSKNNDSSSRTTGSSDNTGRRFLDVSQEWLYVTPSDVFKVVDTKKKGSASSFVAAVKAPVGSTVQVSTPVETNVIDLEGKQGSHQLLISSSGSADKDYNVDSSAKIMGMTAGASSVQAVAVKRNDDGSKKEKDTTSPMNFPSTKKRKEPVEIYLLDRKRDRMQRLSDDFMLGLIQAPDYTLERQAANDIFHTSCLREDEGVSSFF